MKKSEPIPLPDLTGPEHAEFASAFWSNVEKQPGDGCWLWTGKRKHDRSRYRLFDYGLCDFGDRRDVRAHRLAYALSKGEVPRHALVLHGRCDRPPCVRPDHLHLADQVRNMGESAVRGRTGMRRFSPEIVDEMRRLRAEEGLTYPEIAARYGAHVNTVGHLVAWRLKKSRYLPTSIRPKLSVKAPISERVNLELADCLISVLGSNRKAAAWLGVDASSLWHALHWTKGRGRPSIRPMPAVSSRVAALVGDLAPTAPLLWLAGGLAADGLFGRVFAENSRT